MFTFLKKIYHFLIAYGSYWYYGRPSRKLIVIGVTGTKGKSTTCRFIASVLEAGGFKVGVLTTVEFQIAERRWLNDKKMTMLGRGQVQKMLRDMVQAGCRYAVVETSSEGILQYRHLGLNYDIAVFTNLGSEHAERHGGFENLKKSKGELFASLNKTNKKIISNQLVPKIIVVNLDDVSVDYYLCFHADKKFGYTLKNTEILKYFNIKILNGQVAQSNESGVEFSVDRHNYFISLIGNFNVYNAMAAIAVGRSQQISDEQIAVGLKSVALVEGRLEFINEGQNFYVVVDYAHEPISLTELFKTLREVYVAFHTDKHRRLIAVIGSDGGGRDKGKREKMGRIAGEMAEIVMITDVNCFDEDPREIAQMLAVGARTSGKKDGVDLFIETNRHRAIEKAFSFARAGDVVAITAKGTEPCIVQAGGNKIPWDDRSVAREILRIMSKS